MDYPIRGLVDIRRQLVTNPAGGPQWRVDHSTRRGIALHYNGPAVDLSRDDLAIIRADSAYHCAKDWGGGNYGDGLMYSIDIWRDGSKCLCRDLENVLWHCGNANPYYYAIHLSIGGDQRANTAQLNALREVVDDIVNWRGWSRKAVVGHQELMSTSCPGTLMQDFILPYREGASNVADGMQINGHYIGGAIFDFWNGRGGIAIFGLPLSDEADAIAEDGEPVVQQWFERARMEWVRRTGEVRLARVGAELMEMA